ncbi:hypothetical protein CCACVL1_05837 [Corchorus capsularis]|uniref:Uncharacterized protein n=1 Tax=Corchorus capsularis TaxID=210143 RepID=A0A1R3JJ12_COCAP|nr:hypothetical protein CCACVL1_05837 [Corchorus capsularis]
MAEAVMKGHKQFSLGILLAPQGSRLKAQGKTQ